MSELLDSLTRLAETIPNDQRRILVFCEEADQLANHATTGQTLKGKYAATQQALASLLTRADSIVLAEARIPENTLKYFEEISGKPTRVFTHQLETQKRQVKVYGGQASGFEAMILERLRAGEKLIITSDSQRELDAIERLIAQELPELKGMRNDQKTSYIPAVKELTVSPNTVLAREQLFCLSYSPSCKSGWDLTGKDKDGNSYEFDRVMAIFRVLPTSDQIQMLARYRPDCPWDIYLSETIQVSGNECNASPRKLSRSMEEEAVNIAQGWGIDYDPSNRPELEKIARDHYVVATTRAGLEKRINRYSMVQRLLEDGHSVVEEKLEYCKPMANRMKSIKKEIDRDWAALVASIHLAPTDDLELAKKLEQMEAPSPEQRAKAEKIRLSVQHPGVDFDHAEFTYQATRDYQALVRGVDMEAAARNIQVVAASQKKATTEHFEQSILAIHHLPHRADRAYLILDCGILELLSSGKVFTSASPEVLELKDKILARAKEWERQFSFHFTNEQAPISFLTRAAKCLAIKFHVSRPGTGDRLRQYQVYTPELIDRLIQEGMDKLEGVRVGYEGMTAEQLGKVVESKRRSVEQRYPEGTFDGMEYRDPLVALTAGCRGVIDRLLDLRSQVEARSALLESVMGRYLVASSTVSIVDDLDIESVDGGEGTVGFVA
jgi:hypothetical protein